MKIIRWCVLLILLWATSAYAEVAVHELKQRVTDLTATLNAAQIQTLEAKLADFESKKGSQIGVLIVPSTQPETIEQYSIRVVEKWKLGRKGVDDGVLLLVAKNDRKLRIEVGRGLEGALNDATAKRIIAEVITPAFKQGDFAGGINAGTDSIIKVVNGEVLSPVPKTSNHNDGVYIAVSPSPENVSVSDKIMSLLPDISLQNIVILFFASLYSFKLFSFFYRFRYGKKLINNQYVQTHPLLQKLIIIGDAIELSSGRSSSGGGSGGSSSSSGGGSFGGGGSSGSW